MHEETYTVTIRTDYEKTFGVDLMREILFNLCYVLNTRRKGWHCAIEATDKNIGDEEEK